MKLTSTFALLDVTKGRKALDKYIGSRSHYLHEDDRIPIVIRGFISCRHGRDDGESQEFGVDVTSVEAEVPAKRQQKV